MYVLRNPIRISTYYFYAQNGNLILEYTLGKVKRNNTVIWVQSKLQCAVYGVLLLILIKMALLMLRKLLLVQVLPQVKTNVSITLIRWVRR